jgi:SP family arabinose:H+ symporter-like MFS transporter
MNDSVKSQGSIWYVIGISLIAALGGFLFGFDMTVVSGAIPFIEKVFTLSGASLGWAVSSCILACVVGAAFAGKLADVFGRKKVLLGTAMLFAISAIGAGWASSFYHFILYRLLGGLAIGAASGVAPIYVAETAPTRFRGRFVSFYQLAIVVGISASYYSNYFLLRTGDEAWRWMFTAGVVPAALFFFLLFLVPETPRWLAKSGNGALALEVLSRIDGPAYAQREIEAIRETLRVRKGRLADLLQPRMFRIVVIGSLLGIFSQISGANAVFLYAPRIFAQAGAGLRDSLFQTSLIGLINFFCTFIPITFVERAGRRPLLMVGVACMTLSMTVLSYLFFTRATGLVVLVVVLTYIAAYCSSIACLTWVILSEIFPNRIRGEAMSVANLCLWSANYLLLQTFPMIEARFGIASAFGTYSLICAVIFIFVWESIPETKGKSLEEIEVQLVGLPETTGGPLAEMTGRK